MSAAQRLKAPPGASARCVVVPRPDASDAEAEQLHAAGAPRFADVSVLAEALVNADPERCLWARNWPQPKQNPQPSSAAMLDLLLEWADDGDTRGHAA